VQELLIYCFDDVLLKGLVIVLVTFPLDQDDTCTCFKWALISIGLLLSSPSLNRKSLLTSRYRLHHYVHSLLLVWSLWLSPPFVYHESYTFERSTFTKSMYIYYLWHHIFDSLLTSLNCSSPIPIPLQSCLSFNFTNNYFH